MPKSDDQKSCTEPSSVVDLPQAKADMGTLASLLEKRVRELNCVNEVGHRIDEKPALPEFFEWICDYIPVAFQYPEDCIVAIEYDGIVYGNAEALDQVTKSVGDLRIDNHLVGWLHIAYRQQSSFIDAESALIGSLVSRISSYIDVIRTQEASNRRTEELMVLNELGTATSSVLELHELLEHVYRCTSRLMDVSNFYVALYEQQSQILTFPLAYVDGNPIELPDQTLGNGLTEYIIRHGRPLVFSENVLQHMQDIGVDFVEMGDDDVPLSWIGVPIIYDNRVLGVISLQTITADGLYRENELRVLDGISQQIAKAIAYAKQYKATTHRADQLALVAQVSTDMSRSLDVQELIQSVVDLTQDRFGLYHVHMYLLDETGDLLRLVAGAGEIGRRLAASGWMIDAAVDQSLVARAARQHQGIVVNDVSSQTDYHQNELLPETRAELAVPLLAGEQLLGVLDIRSAQVNHFSREDVDVMTTLAAQVAISLQNARRYQEVQESGRVVQTLNEMSQEINSTLDPERVLSLIYEYTNRLMKVDSFFIARYDDQTDLISYPLSYNSGVRSYIPSRPLRSSITDHIIRTRKPLLFSEDVVGGKKALGIETVIYGNDRPALSWLGVPLLFGDRILGVISVQSTERPRAYTEIQQGVLSSIASLAANAFTNAEQYQHTQQALSEVSRSQALLQSVIDTAPDWITIKDLDHRFQLVNRVFAADMGRNPEEIIGETELTLGIPEEIVLGDPEKGLRGLWVDDQVVIEDGEAHAFPVDRIQINGNTHLFNTIKTPLRNESGKIWGILSFSRDMTERELLLEQANEQAHHLAGLNEISSLMQAAENEPEILALAGAFAGRVVGFDNIQIVLLEGDRRARTYTVSPDERGLLAHGSEIPDETNGVYRTLAENCLIAWPDEPDIQFVFSLPFKDNLPYHTAMAAPLQVGTSSIGAILVGSTYLSRYEESHKSLIMQVAALTASAIENRRLLERLKAGLSETQRLYSGSSRINKATTLSEVACALAETTWLGSMDRVIIWLFDRLWSVSVPDMMLVAAIWDRGGGGSYDQVGIAHRLAEFPLLDLLRPDCPLIVEDITSDQWNMINGRDLSVLDSGLRGMAIWPLIAAGEWIGLVTGQSRDYLHLSEDAVSGPTSLVGQSATVIQRIRLQSEMRSRLAELTNLQRMMSRDAWVDYSGKMQFSGYLFDQVAVQPLTPEQLVEKPKLLGNLRHQPGETASVQLAVSGEPIGLLGLVTEPGREFTAEEEAFLEAISVQVSQALERARLLEQTQKSAVELQAVAEVSTATATILDPMQLLQQVVDLAKDRFNLYHAHIFLADEQQANVNLVVGSGEVGRAMAAEGWSIPIDQTNSLVAAVARERIGKLITDVSREEYYSENMLLPETMSELAVPMLLGNSLIGVFDVQASTTNRFTEDDIRTYNTLAAQSAVALQNARLYAEQLRTVDRLRELDNMKSAFLANMSHELRTPLNSILGFTQVIIEGLDGPLTGTMVEDLELVEKNGMHLLRLINDVLDMAKIEAGRFTLSLEPINLYELLDDVVLTSAPLARDKNLTVEMIADATGDWFVLADHVRIRQIFINLIGNAIKFTETGGITIELDQTGLNEASSRIQVKIRDTGIGIPNEHLERVFEAFSQVDSSTTRKVGGTGLGLPISRKLVELHGGRLWAASNEPDRGTTFIMELPVGSMT